MTAVVAEGRKRAHGRLEGRAAFVWWLRGWFGLRKWKVAFQHLTYWYCPACGTGWSRSFFRHMREQLNYCSTCLYIEAKANEGDGED